jgi:hypothetical protein
LLLCLDYHGMFESEPDYWGGNNFWPENPYNVAISLTDTPCDNGARSCRAVACRCS